VKLMLLRLYTLETFLYGTLNRACRFNDLAKVDTLGPYALVLSKILRNGRPRDDQNCIFDVYRGCDMTEA